MSKSKLNIELDRTHIDPNDIDGDGKKDGKPLDEIYDNIGYERDKNESFKESRKERKFKLKKKLVSISLHLGDGLRLAERFANKYLGFLIGNNESPAPKLLGMNLNAIYIIIITVLIILLWIK